MVGGRVATRPDDDPAAGAPLARHSFHSVAWLIWALAAAGAVQLAPSPVYVALVIGIAALVVEVHAPDGPFRRAFPALVMLGVAFSLVRVVIAALTTHLGEHVLFTLPQATLPRLLGGFTVGGTVEAGVVLQALAQGFVIVGVMAVFGAFNAVVSHYELVQSAPRAFYEIGLITTVALAFVPSTIESVVAVREADRARTGGRAVRRGRALRLVIPVLERGMERAVSLAESMDSRGFAHGGASRDDRIAGWTGLAALLALGAAFVALVGRSSEAAIALGLLGGGLVVASVVLASRAARRERYRPRRVTTADRVMASASLLAPLLLGLLALNGHDTLTWTASPLAWPRFSVLPLLALVPLLAPLATEAPRRRVMTEVAA